MERQWTQDEDVHGPTWLVDYELPIPHLQGFRGVKRNPFQKNLTQIRTDTLIDILEVCELVSYMFQIDQEARTVRVEPMVTMGQLTRVLIPLGENPEHVVFFRIHPPNCSRVG